METETFLPARSSAYVDRPLMSPPADSAPAAHPGYRADIDGLRAIAVLSVIGFHAFPTVFPGGFVGVDIFFVISGYLITGILVSGLREGRFNLVHFYARRIQRIFPALLLVLGVCLVVGWLTLLPDEFQDLGRHGLASAGFLSNWLLWHLDVYFDAQAITRPLQHLWSLAVEEQFYIAWPVVLWLAWRLRLNGPVVICILAAGSFALSLQYSFSPHFLDNQIAFGSPLTRAWELLLGGLLTYTGKPRGHSARNDMLAVAGIILLAFVLVGISPVRAFPGFWALLPTVGTCLIIAAGPRAWLNARVLATRPCQMIGLISYPLYLWHWPLLSFARVLNGATPPVSARILLAGLAIFLAALTYRVVERPIRRARLVPSKAIALLAGMLIIGSVSYAGIRYDPLDGRPLIRQLADYPHHSVLPGYGPCRDPQLVRAPRIDYCTVSEQGDTDAVLIGDSHAEDKLFGLVRLDHEHRWAMLSIPACPPVYAINVYGRDGLGSDCGEKSVRVIDWVNSQPRIKTVVLGFYGNEYVLTTAFAADHLIHHTGPDQLILSGAAGQRGSRAELLFRGLDQAIEHLEQAGKQVVILLDLPEFPFLPRDCYRRQDTSECRLARAAVDARQSPLRAVIAQLQRAHPGVRVFNPLERFCSSSQCVYSEAGQLLYQDSNHLSRYGSDRYAEVFSRWLKSP